MAVSNNIKGALLSLAAFTNYAFHDVIVRYLGSNYSPLQVLFFTSLLSFPLMILILVGDRSESNLRPVHPWWMALRSLTMVVGASSGFYAFATLPLAQVYSILFTVPLIITLLSIPVLGEKVGVHRAGAIIVGLLGVLVVVRPGAEPLSSGHAAAFTAAICVALQSVVARRIGNDERSIVMMVFPFLAILVVMGTGMGFVYEPIPLMDFWAMAAVAVMGFVSGLLLVGAYRLGEAAIVAPMQYCQIIWGTIFGALLFNERPDTLTLVGAVIIIASGVYIVLRETRGASANTPVLRTRTRGVAPGTFRISQILKIRRQ
ncbi:DMT family transporter [Cognatishimia sp. SS12]|uniref:DMT family transporter n=1 Tax=Cognatishimia sp. SS12 TaxID=2979465 RepID=UPI00232DE987|nr:DMT family transporter [Cognatishimia sp. SS12]MDC0739211.1 DMT family transporter [Cognatishimia sp. SS12]